MPFPAKMSKEEYGHWFSHLYSSGQIEGLDSSNFQTHLALFKKRYIQLDSKWKDWLLAGLNDGMKRLDANKSPTAQDMKFVISFIAEELKR